VPALQYSLRRFFWSATAIAVAFGGIVCLYRISRGWSGTDHFVEWLIAYMALIHLSALFGAGLCGPFKRTIAGAVCGFLLGASFPFLWFLLLFAYLLVNGGMSA
jgi:hypothetical protein